MAISNMNICSYAGIRIDSYSPLHAQRRSYYQMKTRKIYLMVNLPVVRDLLLMIFRTDLFQVLMNLSMKMITYCSMFKL